MSPRPNSDDVIRAITPFDTGAKGAGLKEAAMEVLLDYGSKR